MKIPVFNQHCQGPSSFLSRTSKKALSQNPQTLQIILNKILRNKWNLAKTRFTCLYDTVMSFNDKIERYRLRYSR